VWSAGKWVVRRASGVGKLYNRGRGFGFFHLITLISFTLITWLDFCFCLRTKCRDLPMRVCLMLHYTRLLIAAAAAVAGGLLISTAPATASTITDSTRLYSAGVLDSGTATSADYVAEWATLAAIAPTSGYGDYSLTSWASVNNPGGAHTDVATHLDASFYTNTAGTWSFRIALDAGWGGTFLVDGVAIQTRDTDMWWGGSWGSPTQYLTGTISLGVGSHTLDAYSLEPGGDGSGQGQFSGPASGGVFTTFSATDGLSQVPEPCTLAILGLGLTSVGLVRRRRAVKTNVSA
jgi:hypothetical protein